MNTRRQIDFGQRLPDISRRYFIAYCAIEMKQKTMCAQSIPQRLIDAINRLRPSSLARFIVLAVVSALVALAIKEKIVQSLLSPALLAALLFSLIKHLVSRHLSLRKHLLRSSVRFVRGVRKTFATSWDIELLHLTVLTFCLVWLIFFAIPLTSYHPTLGTWTWCITALFFLAGAIDAVRVTLAITKFAWAKWTGKACYAFVAAFSIWAADVLAKKMIAQATGFAPESFAATERLLHWLLTPLIGLGMIVGSLSILSLITYIVILIGSLLTQQIQTLMSAMPRLAPKEKASIAYRLRHGKNRMKGAPTRIIQWENAVQMMRPLAVSVTGTMILAGLAHLHTLSMAKIGPLTRELVVQIEFYQGQKCGARISREPIKHLEGNTIVVATKVEGDWALELNTCEATKRSPNPP